MLPSTTYKATTKTCAISEALKCC